MIIWVLKNNRERMREDIWRDNGSVFKKYKWQQVIKSRITINSRIINKRKTMLNVKPKKILKAARIKKTSAKQERKDCWLSPQEIL